MPTQTNADEAAEQINPSATSEVDAKRRRLRPLLLGSLMIVAGIVIGAVAVGLTRPSTQMAPLAPVAINALPDTGIVTVRGNVAEIFGNKFIVADSTGRALIETGRAGEGGKLVSANEAVTVQGRFESGFIHATYLVRSNGEVDPLGPPPPLPGGPRGWLDRLVGHHKPDPR